MNRAAELDAVRAAISEGISCEKTLGISAAARLPVACAGPYILRRRDGKTLFSSITTWKVSAECSDSRLKISVASSIPDPVLKQIIKVDDLFSDNQPLCRTYFTTESCPPGKTLTGVSAGIAVCADATSSVRESAGFFWVKRGGGTDGQPCIIANEYSHRCSCPTGTQEVYQTSTSLYNQWTRTVFCGK
jgi:hypothetical protein